MFAMSFFMESKAADALFFARICAIFIEFLRIIAYNGTMVGRKQVARTACKSVSGKAGFIKLKCRVEQIACITLNQVLPYRKTFGS